MSRLPLYLGVVAVLGAVSNLATIAVGLGVLTAIFQWGWGSELLEVGEGAPIFYIVPIMIVGVMFGLSMDYQVFLASRMREEWAHGRDDARSVRVGVAETKKVITAAAAIMLRVFASFGVARGLSKVQIAERLFIRPATVKTHVNRATMMTVHICDHAQLVVFAYEHGLMTPGNPVP